MMTNFAISEAAARFEQDGYVILDRVFSEAEIAPVSDEIDHIIAGERTYIPERDMVLGAGFESAAIAQRISAGAV